MLANGSTKLDPGKNTDCKNPNSSRHKSGEASEALSPADTAAAV